MNSPSYPDDARTPSKPQGRPALRLFLYEPGWGVGLKVGSERVFCYMMAPGQDFYHRLLDGELYLYNHEERLCFACAERRGLISFEPRTLREPVTAVDLDAAQGVEEIPLEGTEEEAI